MFGIFPKWVGSCLNKKVLRNLFVLFMFEHFSERGGDCLIPNFLMKFSASAWKIFRKGGVPFSKTFEGLFCLSLDIFQEEGGAVV